MEYRHIETESRYTLPWTLYNSDRKIFIIMDQKMQISKADFKSVSSMEQLFEIWKNAHISETDTAYLRPNIPKNMFLPDGIIDEDKYSAASPKILFVAKEANWYLADETAPLSDHNGSAPMFWHKEVAFGRVAKTSFSYRLSMLANAITSASTNRYCVVDKNHTALQSVAVINLNKRGGYSYCIWETLNKYVSYYQAFIRKQIELVAPDIIICCGYDVKWLIDEYELAPPCTHVVTIYHPSYFAISDLDYLDQLRCAMIGEEWHPQLLSKTAVPERINVKGIIFDTNKTYSNISTMDMLLGNKVSAYDDAANLVNSFNIGDYVFLSLKGIGIVAAGRIISKTESIKYVDLFEQYKAVEFLAPSSDQMPHGEDDLKALPWAQITKLLGHGFWHARTDKRPYLSKQECELLIGELKKLY